MDIKKWFDSINKDLIKYIVVVVAFAVIYLFVGDQSVVNRIRRYHAIRQTEAQIKQLRDETQQAQRTIQVLQNKDSLERYAREQYYMHARGEDVYVVDE